MAKIRYNVKGVERRPFPLKDPALAGMKRNEKPQALPELPPQYERFRLYDVDGLDRFPPVEWHIDGYLAVGELSVFFGKGDTYKSFVALDWACSLAAAGELVIYVVSEGASGIKARIAAWQKHHGVVELPTLRLMPSNVNLHREGDVDTWIAAMQHQLNLDECTNPALVVVDTLARNFVGGSENDPKDLGLFVEGVERVRAQLRTAVLVIHHSTVAGDKERGTEALRNASFAMFRFDRVNQSARVKVTCDRMKDAPKPPVVEVKPVVVPLPEVGDDVSSLVAAWGEFNRDPNRASSPDSRPELTRPEKGLLQALADPNQDPNRASLAKRLKVSEETVKRTMKRLQIGGFVRSTGATRNLTYSLTDSGREALT